jgi:hypothetical protein
MVRERGRLTKRCSRRRSGLIGDLLNDPPGFDRGVLPGIDRKIVAFFRQHLLPHN